jgi:hypothetical protein
MPEAWTWNENDLAKLIDNDLDDRRQTLPQTFMPPSLSTLAKLGRWAKAVAVRESRRGPIVSAGRLVVASAMADLYIGMDSLRQFFSGQTLPIPNDETLARMAFTIGQAIKAGKDKSVAAEEVLRQFAVTPGTYLVADGQKPFDMADLDSLNHP